MANQPQPLLERAERLLAMPWNTSLELAPVMLELVARVRELERDHITFTAALEEMEKAGWPCRLVEAPARIVELEHEVTRLKEIEFRMKGLEK